MFKTKAEIGEWRHMLTKKSLTGSFLSLLVIVILAGCGSGGGAASATIDPATGGSESTATANNSGAGDGTLSTGVAKLSWSAPKNADGTPLTGIAGYKIYSGKVPGTYSSSVDIGMTTSYAVNGLAPGIYYFAVTVYDTSGNESSYSNEASKTIP
mgnify:CR=1 FL=1